MKILAISGSLHSRSSNTALLRAALDMASNGVEVELSPSLGLLPHFNPELDGQHAPSPVVEFRTRIKECVGILIATPEYAHGVPGVLKNALDWIVSSGELMRKPVGLMSSSPNATGGLRAQLALIPTLLVMDALVVAQRTIQIVRKDLDTNGRINNSRTIEQVAEVVRALIESSIEK
ncbi:NADPH-dependent FMN reductase [Tundrisphaera lichenicola]|uniref:NADPH-dependent FMN reductase n=1 Tax=Tundrisphaera lichenicola TaxID=2029860 RepID=UPI003EB7F58F